MNRSIWDIGKSYYHIFNRGVNKQNLYYDDQDKWLFIKVLKSACERYKIEIHAIYLMDNHYHIIIYASEGNLSDAMQYIGRTYAQAFLKKYKTFDKDGHAFRGRFGRKIVDTDTYAAVLLDYIHLNGFKAGLSKHPENDFWSSYDFYKTGEDRFGLLTKGLFAAKFQTFAKTKSGEAMVSDELLNWDPDDHTIGGVILGDKNFARKLYQERIRDDLSDDGRRMVEKALGLNYVIESDLLKEYIDSLQLDCESHSFVSAYALLQWSELTSVDIAKQLNRSASGVRNIKSRVVKLLEAKSQPLITFVEQVERFVISNVDAGGLNVETFKSL